MSIYRMSMTTFTVNLYPLLAHVLLVVKGAALASSPEVNNYKTRLKNTFPIHQSAEPDDMNHHSIIASQTLNMLNTS